MSVCKETWLFDEETPQRAGCSHRFDTVAACLDAVSAAHRASIEDSGGPAGARGNILVLTGDVHAALGSRMDLRMAEAPRAENGWYSKTDLGPGALGVEIVGPATPVPGYGMQGMARARTDALIRLGDADRAQCSVDARPPALELPIDAHPPSDRQLRLDFGTVHDVVQSAEWPLRCDLGAPYTQRAFRMHIFDPVMPRDMMQVWCDLHRDACATGYLVSLRTWIKPTGGAPVAAFAERLLRVVWTG